jgi:hypothetical protein
VIHENTGAAGIAKLVERMKSTLWSGGAPHPVIEKALKGRYITSAQIKQILQQLDSGQIVRHGKISAT